MTTACTDLTPSNAGTAAAAEPEPVHVDSILPIDTAIARFRADLDAPLTALSGGAPSAQDLVARFMRALEEQDMAALAGLVITPAEFIDLYYPHTKFTRAPYLMGPDLVWFQLDNYGSKGLNRALARVGGRDLGHTGHECGDVTEEGPNRIHGGCVVLVHGEAAPASLSLFGPILERDGTFKFISYANSL